MVYLIAALIAAALSAGFLAWRLYSEHRARTRLEARCRSMQQDRAIRQNLQYMLDGRDDELRRLRARLREAEDQLAEAEKQASDLNLHLFHESGLRILREKEEGARRMKLDLLERQLDESNRRLREQRAEIERLNGVIEAQRAELEEQRAKAEAQPAAKPRRALRRSPDGLPNQVTLNDLLRDLPKDA